MTENFTPKTSKMTKFRSRTKFLNALYVSGPHEIMTELPIQRQMTAEELEAGMDNFYGRENDNSLLERKYKNLESFGICFFGI